MGFGFQLCMNYRLLGHASKALLSLVLFSRLSLIHPITIRYYRVNLSFFLFFPFFYFFRFSFLYSSSSFYFPPLTPTQTLTYIYTSSCQKRLEWIVNTGAKRGLRKPSLEEIEHAKVLTIMVVVVVAMVVGAGVDVAVVVVVVVVAIVVVVVVVVAMLVVVMAGLEWLGGQKVN